MMLSSLKVSLRPQCMIRRAIAYRNVTCWKCGTDENKVDYFCGSDACGVVQSYKLKDVNAFQLFNLEQKYFIDLQVLETEYKNVQKLLHPDKFVSKSNDEREASNETSSTVNQAYQVRCAN